MSRAFRITITPRAGGIQGYSGTFDSSIAAATDALDRAGTPDCKVTVRPEQERTYMEGRARWPEQLHPQAFMEAYRGWLDAEQEDPLIQRPDGMTAAMHRRQS